MWKRRHPEQDHAAAFDWNATHIAWVDAIDRNAVLRGDRARIHEYAADVVETLAVRPEGVGGALARFGSRVAAEGWPLDQVSHWIDQLADICAAAPTAHLRSFEAGVALARGWTEGNLRGLHAAECFDAITGLCTTAVLKLRLQQVLEHCSAFDISANTTHRLVIIDADISMLGGFETDARMVVLADLVQQQFTSGETIACDHGRIFVLTDRIEHLADRVLTLVEHTRTRPLLHTARILAWIEDLPTAPGQIDAYLSELLVS